MEIYQQLKNVFEEIKRKRKADQNDIRILKKLVRRICN